MGSNKLDELTRQEWRELGFYYDFDEKKKSWNFSGSREGLLRISKLFDDYTSKLENKNLSEHEHYGPYMYLKVSTWTEPLIAEKAILGTLEDLDRLSRLIKTKLESVQLNDIFKIDDEYSSANEATMAFYVKDENFDPASADILINE